MARVIIFGLRDFASLAHFYLRHDSEHEVVAFCVTSEFMPADPTFEGVPVVAFEDVQNQYSTQNHHFFAPMSGHDMNRRRAKVYRQIRAKGYELISYVSSRATVFEGTPIGDNCFILEDNTIQPLVRIGSNVVLWSGNHIGHHSNIGDHVFLSSHVVVSGHCTIDAHCFLGVNSSLRDGIRLGEGTFVAMASAVSADTKPWSVYRGNPARRLNTPVEKIHW